MKVIVLECIYTLGTSTPVFCCFKIVKTTLRILVMSPEPMSSQKVMRYYLRPEILEKLFSLSAGREVVPVYAARGFGSRPSIVQFPGDLEHMIRRGATSFHCSIEHWKNPLVLANQLKKQEMNALRSGWDLVFDIDSKKDLYVGQITADLVVRALNEHGISTVSVKFSGRRGFHIGVRMECMPKNINNITIAASYPDVLQKVAHYIKQYMRKPLLEEIVRYDKNLETELKGDPYEAVELEENWSNRHLFRMPYSFNEKTWLVSVPVDPEKIRDFKAEFAQPERVSGKLGFLETFEEDSAETLVANALEYRDEKPAEKKKGHEKVAAHLLDGHGVVQIVKKKATNSEMHRSYSRLTAEELENEMASFKKTDFSSTRIGKRVPEEFFPPCIKKGMAGLEDGRKRFMFILINFLKSSGWVMNEIDEKITEFNKNNPEPVDESYVRGQVSYASKRAESFPPPNCAAAGYYNDLKICEPDNICAKIKNPLGYAFFMGMKPKKKKKASRKPIKRSAQKKKPSGP